MATFEGLSFSTRLKKFGRLVRRVQYPLSEPSEPIFDLERYGASSAHSGSTRHSNSTFRRNIGEPRLSRSDTHDPEQESVDIVVVEKTLDENSDERDVETNAGHYQHTNGSSNADSTRHGDSRVMHYEVVILCARTWHFASQFLFTSFQDPHKERHYQRESWFLAKRIAIWTSLYFYIAWGLLLGLYPRPWKDIDYISWVGVLGIGVLPLLPAVLLDCPSRHPWIWQCFLFVTTWSWSVMIVAQLIHCGYYTDHAKCYNKDFVGLFYYLIATPVMGLFALKQSRLFHLIGTIGTLIYLAILLLPLRSSWIRHFFNFLLFHVFILYISYAREKSDRKIFSLRDQLKNQYKATQKAQVAESRASDSKKRFVNYIFHEVRVPLNTSLLAMQNLIGEDVFRGADDDQIELVDVLQSSLGMMEKVLNDVLDFNRMEAGKLLCATTPFEFTKVIRSVFLGLGVAASSKSVQLSSEQDPRIEELGDLLGDEMRLRQILSNLTSNACKFTNRGGRVTIVTKLLLPGDRSQIEDADSLVKRISQQDGSDSRGSDVSSKPRPNSSPIPRHTPVQNKVIIRVEVHDSGMGIRPQDIKNDRLFSPYVQTEIGKRQGGKGTGLGLALVRNIVQLSGGRLGLKSKVGQGSIFWVELPYALVDPAKLQVLQARSDANITSVTTKGVDKADEPSQIDITEAKLHDLSSESPESPSLVRPSIVAHASHSSVALPSASGPSHEQTPDHETALPTQFVAEHRPVLNKLHSSEIEVAQRPMDSSISNGPTWMPRPFSPSDGTISATPVQPISIFGDIDEQPLSILVVDDDLLTRRLMTRMITRLGHSVQSLENGLLGLNAIKLQLKLPANDEPPRRPFDLVFLDNQMPVLSGVEMVTRARIEGLDTMIVGVTGNAMKEDQDEYLECGADHVLIKPVMEPKIKEMIMIAKSRRRQRLLDEPGAASALRMGSSIV